VAQDIGQMTIGGVSVGKLPLPSMGPAGITQMAYANLQASDAYIWEAAIA
jgi:hypothetical protein